MHYFGAERDMPLITVCYPAAAPPTSCQQVPLNLPMATKEGDWRMEEVKECLTPFYVVNGIHRMVSYRNMARRVGPWQRSRWFQIPHDVRTWRS